MVDQSPRSATSISLDSELFAAALLTYDMGFTPALSSVLVAGGYAWRVADYANVSAVTANAALWIWGFQAVPTRQTVGTPATGRSKLAPTLSSHLEDEQVEKSQGQQNKGADVKANKQVEILCKGGETLSCT